MGYKNEICKCFMNKHIIFCIIALIHCDANFCSFFAGECLEIAFGELIYFGFYILHAWRFLLRNEDFIPPILNSHNK